MNVSSGRTPWARRFSGVVAPLLALTTGCAGSTIYDPVDLAPLPQRPVTFVVDETEMEIAFNRLDVTLVDVLGEAGYEAMVLRTAAERGGATPRFLISIKVENYVADGEGTPGGAIAIYITGSLLLIPFAFIGLVRSDTEHRLDFEVAVRDLRSAPTIVEESAEGASATYDTSKIVPFYRHEYHVEMETARGWLAKETNYEDDQTEHRREVARQMAIRMMNVALPDVLRAVDFALQQPPPPPPEPVRAPEAAPEGPGPDAPPAEAPAPSTN